MTSSPVDNDNMASLIQWDDEEGDLKTTTPIRNQKVPLNVSASLRSYKAAPPVVHNMRNNVATNGGMNKPKNHPSSRIRYLKNRINQSIPISNIFHPK